MGVLGNEVGLIPRELLERGNRLREELHDIDIEIGTKLRELKASRSRLEALVRQETGFIDYVGLTRYQDPEAPEKRAEEEEHFDEVKAEIDELREQREEIVKTIRREFVVVELEPGALDLREPTRSG